MGALLKTKGWDFLPTVRVWANLISKSQCIFKNTIITFEWFYHKVQEFLELDQDYCFSINSWEHLYHSKWLRNKCLNIFKTKKTIFFRTLDQINECTYDPPYVSNGTFPRFAEGALVNELSVQSIILPQIVPSSDETTGPSKFVHDHLLTFCKCLRLIIFSDWKKS